MLLAALFSESILGQFRVAEILNRHHSPSLLFMVDPYFTTTYLPAPPPAVTHSDEMQRRLDDAGARSGDVQISLAWNNTNDLDLSCIDPNGELIDGYNQTSRSGGALDVDMNPTDPSLILPESNAKLALRNGNLNASRRTDSKSHPVENIVWQSDRAPQGHYKVFVHQFCNKEHVAATLYWVEVRVHGKLHRIDGSAGRDDFARDGIDPKLVYEFDLGAEVAAIPAVVPQAQNSQEEKVVSHLQYSGSSIWLALLAALLWGGFAGLFLPTSLLIGQKIYLREPAWNLRRDSYIPFAGLAAGGFACLTGQIFLSSLSVLLPVAAIFVAHLISWGLFGCFFAGLLSLFTPRIYSTSACAIGFISGLLASGLFLAASAQHSEALGHLTAALVLGAGIGALIAMPVREEAVEELQPVAAYRPDPTMRTGSMRSRATGKITPSRRRRS